ncbi:hypothetical protein MtrunA17_Chr3g0090021 [Medicago truncatula]|uniref:Uncharacterized protein n=1 Tax=Medicago truncatula TaxID=3880 RepID=A0A396IPT0_MEDTR|nr:hypothetical protein MtrunA17_Chr3g0090021 [Medicago truncatula]
MGQFISKVVRCLHPSSAHICRHSCKHKRWINLSKRSTSFVEK